MEFETLFNFNFNFQKLLHFFLQNPIQVTLLRYFFVCIFEDLSRVVQQSEIRYFI